MKVKLLDIINSKEVLEHLSSCTFEAKVSYIIQKNIKAINAEFNNVDETKMKLFEKYGEKLEDSRIRIKEENVDSYNKEMNDLLFQEIDIDIMQIPLEEFDSMLSPIDMGKIDWMFKF